MGNGMWVGLDVHAKSVVAGLICEGTGELSAVRYPPSHRGGRTRLGARP